VRGAVLSGDLAAVGVEPVAAIEPVEQVADRRVRRTRRALQQAIVELVIERGFGPLTVDDVTARADVTRATFYKHYANKDELLADVAEGFATDVIAAFEHRPAGTSRLVPLLEEARKARDVTRIILSGEGNGVALRRFAGIVEQVFRDDLRSGRLTPPPDDVDADLLVGLRAAQVLATTSWFIERDDADAEGTARTVTRLLDRGWPSAAGDQR